MYGSTINEQYDGTIQFDSGRNEAHVIRKRKNVGIDDDNIRCARSRIERR